MKTPWTSINRAAVAVVALIAGLLWHLSARRFRMASTCEELKRRTACGKTPHPLPRRTSKAKLLNLVLQRQPLI
jgi:hypothetical protein